MMFRTIVVTCTALLIVSAVPSTAAADWLLTGFVAPIFNVKSAESDIAPEESFDSSVGFGINLASAFPTRGNLGFELDWAYYPSGLKTSDEFDTVFASKLMTITTNFFYSPAIPRVRPYFAVGPSFSYRSDHSEAVVETPSDWAVGINAGGGIMAFVNPRFGGRIDVRYFRNFGDFYDLRTNNDQSGGGWKDVQFIRLFFGGTVVL